MHILEQIIWDRNEKVKYKNICLNKHSRLNKFTSKPNYKLDFYELVIAEQSCENLLINPFQQSDKMTSGFVPVKYSQKHKNISTIRS